MDRTRPSPRASLHEPFLAIPRSVVNRSDLAPIDKLLYAWIHERIRLRADLFGAAEIRLPTAAAALGISTNTARRSIARLTATQLLKPVHHSAGDTGSWYSTLPKWEGAPSQLGGVHPPKMGGTLSEELYRKQTRARATQPNQNTVRRGTWWRSPTGDYGQVIHVDGDIHIQIELPLTPGNVELRTIDRNELLTRWTRQQGIAGSQ